MPSDEHDEGEAFLVSEAHMAHEVDSRRCRLGADAIYVVPAGALHRVWQGSSVVPLLIDR